MLLQQDTAGFDDISCIARKPRCGSCIIEDL
ncbi:hypothetical protein ACUOA8_27620, partial [Escherichia sp. SS-MK2]